MAEKLDDCEFWLPPQFLTDDDFLKGFQQSKNGVNKCSGRDFQQEFSYGLGAFGTKSNSGLSSPVESVEGSTETESDEDDYITGLTQRMAHSTLEEHSYSYEKKKGMDFSGSPKSPLCKQGLRSSTPRSHSQVSAHSGLNKNEWDLLRAAAGEVARLKMVEESAMFHSSRNGPTRKLSPVAVQPLENLGFRPNQNQFAYQQLQAARFEQLKRQQMLLQQQKAVGGCGHLYQVNHNQQMAQGNGARRPVAGLSMSAWPTLQQSQQQQQQSQHQPQGQPQPQPGSGMRAVFLGNPAAKRECAGTGVFLPRRIGSPTENRKNKPACSTVLLPDRVVHALNLNLEKIDSQPPVVVHQPGFNPNPNPTFTPDYDAAMKYRKNVLMAHQQRQQQHMMRPSPSTQSVMNQELQLPQEWTY